MKNLSALALLSIFSCYNPEIRTCAMAYNWMQHPMSVGLRCEQQDGTARHMQDFRMTVNPQHVWIQPSSNGCTVTEGDPLMFNHVCE